MNLPKLFGRKLVSQSAGLPQLYPWRSSEAYRAQVRQAQIVALDALARRQRCRVLRLVPRVETYSERARAAQRRGFDSFMARFGGGGHLY